jgi:hypothetical protein
VQTDATAAADCLRLLLLVLLLLLLLLLVLLLMPLKILVIRSQAVVKFEQYTVYETQCSTALTVIALGLAVLGD